MEPNQFDRRPKIEVRQPEHPLIAALAQAMEQNNVKALGTAFLK